ncbi:hypothetical protein ABB37_08283 [Leptomonas pyrrhocoris]|uniref:Integral membrane bound transporter domain-containing protein n=1 Tax=Leptomonas pyrrhocoris TaxID=157538 RepID=A0A0N0VDJ7_LEPPY|nr:hypothetical protein ABB37_08283 [Leptomonas pyrrhocoris]KPA75744.1 hypothetical protein ABB37_08283 [Leptomonas pyrrhocoris]|eukprot:XP_015654183.1 hypothetical protein ABB37_08283 [Leptomonas pyrrhocoris]
MPVPPRQPPADMARESSSGPSSPRATPSLAGSPTGHERRNGGGARLGVTSSRGGRRHVRARVLPRTDSAGSLTSASAGSPISLLPGDFPRTGAGSHLLPLTPAHPSEGAGSARSTEHPASRSSSSDAPSTHAPTAHNDENERREEQERERLRGQEARKEADKEAIESILSDPERHRRAIATGSSNPLHVWSHESAFVKSRYFSLRRRRDERKYEKQNEQAGKFYDEYFAAETAPDAGVWSRGSSDQSPTSSSNAVQKRLLADTAGNGGSGGNGGNNNNRKDGRNISFGMGSYYLPPVEVSLLEKKDSWAQQDHCRTRNMNALHAFSWDQRVFLPQRQGFFSPVFDLLASPRLWEKLDWTIRGSVLTILPTLILCTEPSTRKIFPMPTSVVFLAYWTTQPTLGAGLRETFIVLKGFSISLVILLIIIAINPGPSWVTLIILFCCLLVTGFVAEQMKRTVAYCFASLLMQYISSRANTGYRFVGNYYATILIGQGFGLASFMFPYIRWSSENARRYIVITGDAVSLSVHGACCSFWVKNSLLERQLHVARLRQLRSTIQASMAKAQQGLSEMGYEPHSGVYAARLKTRMAFLKNVFNVVQSMTLVIEQVGANPALVETPMCREFGERIREELNLIASAMDSIILRIVDLDNVVSVTDMTAFRLARTRFEEAVSNVRDEVILSNPDYRTDNSDILLGFFLFSVEELTETISKFEDAAQPPSNLWYFVTFPLRDLQSSWAAFVDLYHAIRIRRSITRRLKEAIKLSVCIIVAAIFQVYGLKNDATSPVAGVEIIAFVYRATGGESFQYSTLRMLGTVLGSLTGLLAVQIANGRRPTLYGCTLVLTFIGSYVQAAPDYGALGSALANSVVSIVLQYKSQPNATTRIQQNCFAILIYFIISSLIWPVRGRTKVNTGLDMSLRMAREATDRLLRNLDLPDSATAVSADVLAVLGEMQKKVSQQLSNIPGAVAEPTLDSVGFPEMPWRMLVSAQRKLLVTLLMMRHAYHTFMTSTIADVEGSSDRDGKRVLDNVDMIGAGPAAATSISVHWVVLHRISPHTRHLSQLFYEAVEVYLLTLSKATFVPTADLTRLRLGMMQCYDRIVAVYIETIQRELNTSDSEEGEEATSDDDDGGADGGDPTTTATAPPRGGDGTLTLGAVAGFVPPPASTFAPHPTTVGGTADGVDAVQNNKSNNSSVMRGGKNRTLSAGNVHRTSSSMAGPARTSSSLSKKGAGHFSYKLTPEERQRLREYVLGPNSAGMDNMSFFSNAAAMAAAAEHRGATTTTTAAEAATGPRPISHPNSPTTDGHHAGHPAAPNTTGSNNASVAHSNVGNRTFAGGFVSNRSMLNPTGSFRSRNASMLDSAMLRNAGIVLQEPVHEAPQHRHDGSESGAFSTLRNSFMPRSGGGNRGRRSSPAGGNRDGNDPTGGGDDADGSSNNGADENAEAAARTVSDQLSMRSEGEGSTVPPPPPQRRRGSSLLRRWHHSSSPHQSAQFTERDEGGGSGGAAAPSMLSQDPHTASAHQGLTVKKSKTAKYAVPSVLQMSMVLPAGAYALRNPEATAAAAAAGTTTTVSPSFHAAVPSASRPEPPSAQSAAGTAPSAPPSPTTTLLNNNSNQSFVSAAAGVTGIAAGDVFSLGRGARAPARPASPVAATGPTGNAHGPTGAAPHPHPLSTGEGEAEDDGEGHQRTHRGTPRAFSNAPTAAPSQSAAASASPTHARGAAEHAAGDAHEPFAADGLPRHREADRSADSEVRGNADPPGVLGAAGSGLLSGPLQQQIGATASTSPHAAPPESLLPTPIPAPGTGNPRLTNNSIPLAGFLNNSFSAAGPAIPAALQNYVESLAAQQQQQVPPPPAVLGNMSFIDLAANLPVVNRSFLSGNLGNGSALNSTFAGPSGGGSGGAGGRSNTAQQPNSVPLASDHAITSSPPAESATAPPAVSPLLQDSIQANFMSQVSKLEFNNGTFIGPSHGNNRSKSANGDAGAHDGGQALLSLLDVGGTGGSDGDGGDEYVLTNSDIHSLEAFLFGLRAVIVQVEEVERYLLEVVHGNEMATKL